MNTDSELLRLIHENMSHELDRPARFLTGYSDASWRHDEPHRAGGWGAWIRDGNRRILMSGPCPLWVDNASDCELIGVANAAIVAMRKLDQKANIVVVKTDSQDVCRWFGFRRGSRGPSKREAREIIIKVLQEGAERGVKVIVKWVKGHQGTGSTPGYLNTKVDQMARKARLSGKRSITSSFVAP
jgi:ribonuclease HI